MNSTIDANQANRIARAITDVLNRTGEFPGEAEIEEAILFVSRETPVASKAENATGQTTPRPWETYAGHIYATGDNGGNVCSMSDPHATTTVGYAPLNVSSPGLKQAHANAELICRCVNNHEALLEALRELLAGHDDYPAVKNLPELPRWTLARNVLAAAEKE